MTWTDLVVLSGAALFAVAITAVTRRSVSSRTLARPAPAPPRASATSTGDPMTGERALQRLDALRDEVDPQVRVQGISEVARAFIATQFGIKGDASSHAEILEHLHTQLRPQHMDPIRRAFRMADHARHGRPATSHQLPEALELELRTFIHASQPNRAKG